MLEVDVDGVERERKLLVFPVVAVVVNLQLRAGAAADLALPSDDKASAGERLVPVEKRVQGAAQRQILIPLPRVPSIYICFEQPGVLLVRVPVDAESRVEIAKPASDEIVRCLQWVSLRVPRVNTVSRVGPQRASALDADTPEL